MQTFIGPPGIARGEHEMTTDDVVEALRTLHPRSAHHPDLRTAAQAVAGQRRRRVHPLRSECATKPYPAEERYRDRRALMEQAGRRALEGADMAAQDIAGLVVVQDPSPTETDQHHLDRDLVLTLGLPATTARVPLTGMAGCGVVHALAVAADMAGVGRPALVVAGEVHQPLHTVDTGAVSATSLVRQLMAGDGAAAVVVTREPFAVPGLAIEDTWQYARHAAPPRGEGSAHRVADHPGLSALPWLRPGRTLPEFALVHPGGPDPLRSLSRTAPLPRRALETSYTCMATEGDLGGASVLQMLARLHRNPPAVNTPGLLLGLAPGDLAAACRVRWTRRAPARGPEPYGTAGRPAAG
ncbi:chalcone synthase [Streptomyces longispororuber]|uniref:Chalcone synthase n=1 Tax=Streptomyces longispororuber TaxID=68230 RepID=A0A918ZAL2_9ACTN|nr:hypothetical protein [Streptomyces longispororuber]GHE43463.1 chalcone synthase [Streptomyces longispororuber]